MKKGFTLLEMMFVMAVVALLFVLTVPNVQRVLSLLHSKGCDAQLKVVDAAILQYQLIYQEYPQSIQDLIAEDLLSEAQTRCQNQQSIDIYDGQAHAH
jgi:competence protein ComGC